MRIGTRASALALAQANLIAERVVGSEICPVSSAAEGAPAMDKSRWVAGLEAAYQSSYFRVPLFLHHGRASTRSARRAGLPNLDAISVAREQL